MEHVGYKTLSMVVGLVLGMLWVIFDIFKNWLDVGGFTWPEAIDTLSGFAVLVLLIPLIPWIGHMMYRYIYNIEEKAFSDEEEKE